MKLKRLPRAGLHPMTSDTIVLCSDIMFTPAHWSLTQLAAVHSLPPVQYFCLSLDLWKNYLYLEHGFKFSFTSTYSLHYCGFKFRVYWPSTDRSSISNFALNPSGFTSDRCLTYDSLKCCFKFPFVDRWRRFFWFPVAYQTLSLFIWYRQTCFNRKYHAGFSLQTR